MASNIYPHGELELNILFPENESENDEITLTQEADGCRRKGSGGAMPRCGIVARETDSWRPNPAALIAASRTFISF
ncbi:unnamed protein product [Caenorhabditis auriculariae]|uniref:Uncharacterized protein n=1 Tax=Caenorhabditis auriculariae TaxID=2777116 RepID=A0A8S1GRM5_9PELO|nr:unnamed protein product [Caenorhabditis auriculariae]